jgi:hypothetical protein
MISSYEIAKACSDIYQFAPICNELSGAAAKVISIGNCIYVIFRGCDELKDWVSALSPASCDWTTPSGATFKVHGGFCRQWKSVKPVVIEQIRMQLSSRNIDFIVVCGHSSGSGLASIACIDIPNIIISSPPIYCITFASPATGDSKFVTYFDAKVYKSQRFVNDKDPVPMFPIRYAHVPGLIQLNASAGTGESKWYNRLLLGIQYIFSKESREEHHIQSYMDKLKETTEES